VTSTLATLLYATVRYSTLRYSTLLYSTLLYSTLRSNIITVHTQWSTVMTVTNVGIQHSNTLLLLVFISTVPKYIMSKILFSYYSVSLNNLKITYHCYIHAYLNFSYSREMFEGQF
jgi:hypothetical protein